MKELLSIFIFIFTFSFWISDSLGLPYSTSNEIQIYSEVPDSFLSTKAKACMEKSRKAGVMSQLSQNLGCSNFITAKKVCECVDLAFDKNKVQEFLKSEDATELDVMFSSFRSVDINSLNPDQKFIIDISELNSIYTDMGLKSCSIKKANSYSSKIYKYSSSLKSEKSKDVLPKELVARQHIIFNSMLKELAREPSREDLVNLSQMVTNESGEKFFLDEVLSSGINYSETISSIKNTIINDYVEKHLSNINTGIPPEEFKVMPIRREGCREMMSYISVDRDEKFNKKIESNFSTFFPESVIDRAEGQKNKDAKKQLIENTIGDLDSQFSMIGNAEYEKDIFYCSKYNEYKKRSEEFSKNEELKMMMGELEELKENVLVGMLSMSESDDIPEVIDVRERIATLEDKIKSTFKLDDEDLEYTFMGLKIWKADKGVETVVSDDGKISFHKIDPNTKNESIIDKIRKKSNIFERSRSSYANKYKIEISNRVPSNYSTMTSSVSKKSKLISKVVKDASYESKSLAPTQGSSDNYFSRTSTSNNYKNNTSSVVKATDTKTISTNNSEIDIEDSYTKSISKRIAQLTQDKIKTEKTLTDELASTKESLELANLREELRKQSEEISKLTNLNSEVPSSTNIVSPKEQTNSVGFTSPLDSFKNSSQSSSSVDSVSGQSDGDVASRNIASTASFSPGGSQESTSVSSPSSTGSSISNTSSTSDEGFVSGISLSSLKKIGEDIQVVDNSILGGIRPIVVDESFSNLSEDEKREKIEELLGTTLDEEVYIEFPDGKILKFSKTEEVNKKEKNIVAKKEVEPKKRDAFSYDKLKEIIDNTKQ